MDYSIIKELRKQRRIKQYEIASKCGITQSYYSLIEQGLKNPSVKVLENICNELDLELRMISKA